MILQKIPINREKGKKIRFKILVILKLFFIYIKSVLKKSVGPDD